MEHFQTSRFLDENDVIDSSNPSIFWDENRKTYDEVVFIVRVA